MASARPEPPLAPVIRIVASGEQLGVGREILAESCEAPNSSIERAAPLPGEQHILQAATQGATASRRCKCSQPERRQAPADAAARRARARGSACAAASK